MTMRLFELATANRTVRPSPFCWRARMALAHKGLEAEYLPVRFTEKEKIAFSGQKLVPVLCDGETTVADSWAIANYLEQHYPDRPHLFDCGQARAHALFIDKWTQHSLHPGIFKQILLDLYESLDEADKPYFRESREARVGTTLEAFVADADERLPAFRAGLAPLQATLKAQDFLGGEAPSYADYIVFGAFQWARYSSPRRLVEAETPLAAWLERMQALHGGLGAEEPAAAG